jgi:hypothetical protein
VAETKTRERGFIVTDEKEYNERKLNDCSFEFFQKPGLVSIREVDGYPYPTVVQKDEKFNPEPAFFVGIPIGLNYGDYKEIINGRDRQLILESFLNEFIGETRILEVICPVLKLRNQIERLPLRPRPIENGGCHVFIPDGKEAPQDDEKLILVVQLGDHMKPEGGVGNGFVWLSHTVVGAGMYYGLLKQKED